jgi:phosphocarrier protein
MSPDGHCGGGNGQSAPLAEDAPDRAANVRRVVKICNQKGLHARAAARFVKTASQFDAEVTVRKNGTSVSGRSIMGLMMLAAASGSVIEIAASGADAAVAVEALARLIECKFDED